MKNAIRNFNRNNPANDRWLSHEDERLEHIQLKRQTRAKKETNDDKTEHGDCGVLPDHEG